MIDIITAQQCYTSPTAYWTIKYEYKREGADMYYRFNWTVWLAYSTSYYDYAMSLIFYLDGVADWVTVKGVSYNEYQWTKSGTSDWIKVSGKTTGTTSFYVQLYDSTRYFVMSTSGTYNLAVSAAASALGTVANFNVGDSITIPITKYDSTFTDTLVISYGSTTLKTVSGITNNAKVSFTSAELTTIYGLMSTVKSGTFTFTLTTKTGSSTLGSSTKSATGSITNANPTFTAAQVTYADTNTTVVGITGNNQHIVQNKSSLTVYLESASGNKGASISKYDVTVNGVKKTATAKGSIPFGAVNTSQNTSITVVVTDSRGNTTTVSKTVTILAYSTPTYAVTLERLNNYEDETYLTVDASIASVNGKNTLAISYKKKQNGGSYGSATTLSNRTKHTTSCNKDYIYVFSITVSDKFETVTREYILPNGKFPLFIDTEKNAVGVNEFPGNGEALRVAGGVACFDDGIVLKGETKAFNVTIDDSGKLNVAAPAGYGLGDVMPAKMVGDLNNAIENGVYRFSDSCANKPPHGSGETVQVISYGENIKCQVVYLAHHYGTVWYRWKAYDTWGEWECSNPPMTLGVEYRTTERYAGKVVYTQLVDCGNLPNASQKNVTFPNVTTYEKIISVSCYAYSPTIGGFNLPYRDSSGANIAGYILVGSYIRLFAPFDASSMVCKALIKYIKD